MRNLAVGASIVLGLVIAAPGEYPRLAAGEEKILRRAPPEIIKEDADNTRVNRRTRSNTADQGSSRADLEMSRKIRRSLTRDSGLSTYARNVKIITRDGGVTLTGPVRSEREKEAVGKIAADVAGAGKVANELTVAPEKQ